MRAPDNLPCVPDCPDRKPGCYCERKQEWDEKRRAKKKEIRDAKIRENMTFEAKPSAWKRKNRRSK